jgi:Uma2 family endonuclease
MYVYRWDRIPRAPSGRVANRFSDDPDAAIEICSPEQTHAEQLAKCRALVDSGVKAPLLVDSIQDTVTDVRPSRLEQVHRDDETIDLTDVIPDLHLTPRQIFASLQLD